MKPTTPFKATKTIYLIISAAFCIIGLIFIIHPAFSAAVIGTLCGIFLIVFGAVKIVGYFSRDAFRLAFQFDLALGILLLALGVIIIIRPDGMMNLLCIALGISVLIDGLFKLNKYARQNNAEMAEKYNVMDCIECGVCSYLCPGKQHPVQNIRLMKQIIAEKRRSQK